MEEKERSQFALAYSSAAREDSAILETIMNDGNDSIWSNMAQSFLRLPDRNRGVLFLIDKATHCDRPANFVQALAISGDKRAIPTIRDRYEKCRRDVAKEKETGSIDLFFGPLSLYFTVCEALIKLDGSAEYVAAVREYLDHPKVEIRRRAQRALGIESSMTREEVKKLFS